MSGSWSDFSKPPCIPYASPDWVPYSSDNRPRFWNDISEPRAQLIPEMLAVGHREVAHNVLPQMASSTMAMATGNSPDLCLHD
jgi:hypothetical protein